MISVFFAETETLEETHTHFLSPFLTFFSKYISFIPLGLSQSRSTKHTTAPIVNECTKTDNVINTAKDLQVYTN